jgi:hypothetical protein
MGALGTAYVRKVVEAGWPAAERQVVRGRRGARLARSRSALRVASADKLVVALLFKAH